MKKIIVLLAILTFYISASAQKEDTIANGNAKIYYRVFGEGKPVLIINGGPGMNSNGFAEVAKKLGEHNMAIIYDQRGTGRSVLDKIDSTTITINLMIEDIEALRNHLGIKKWIVFGHSFGGMLASYYATVHPENIEAMILSSSGGIDLALQSYVQQSINSRLSVEEYKEVDYWTTKINDGDTTYESRLKRGMALAPAYVVNPKNVKQIAIRLTQGNSQVNNLVWQSLQQMKFDCARGLSSFKKPVLIIQGKQDIIKDETALKAKKILKKSKLVLLDHCGHYGWLDAPDEYWKEVLGFVDGI
ncbi:MAG: alpha/beta hydrolase [Bacteroidetes bacterium]|nr:alpha/beta hydrolase [Bacteroidota bacterium]